jgi:hypothetical protein
MTWNWISSYQKLSEPFIKEFSDIVDWDRISKYQKLSEDFIREFSDKVNWGWISEFQKLSEPFIKEFSDKVDIEIQHKSHLDNRNFEDKKREVIEYATKYNLTYDNEYLYAYRNHDFNGSGVYSNNIYYEPNIYYRDWHCDINPENKISFGLGIWSEGNTKVKVKIEDWGTWVKSENNSKARVWGFEII